MGSVTKRRPQPGKNKTIRTERRREIAKALVQQVPTSEIARQQGISRQMVNIEINADETRQFIRHALAPHLDEIRELVSPALQAVKDTLGPTRVHPVPEEDEEGLPTGEVKLVTVPNDPKDRLRAVKTLGYLMELAEGRRRHDDDDRREPRRFSGTYEDLLILHHTTIHETHHHHEASPEPSPIIDVEPEA